MGLPMRFPNSTSYLSLIASNIITMFQFVDGALCIELTAVIDYQRDSGIVQAPAVAARERLFNMRAVGRRHNRKRYLIRLW